MREKNNIKLKIRSIKQNNKLMEWSRVRCDICIIDIRRASYKPHVNTSRKNPMKRVVKETNKVSNTKVENQNCFTDRILKIAYDIKLDNHDDQNANFQITITSNFKNIRIDTNHINKVMEEMCQKYAKLISQKKFKYQLTVLVLFIKYGEYNEITSEVELSITLSITQNLTQSEIDNINIQWTLENRIKKQR